MVPEGSMKRFTSGLRAFCVVAIIILIGFCSFTTPLYKVYKGLFSDAAPAAAAGKISRSTTTLTVAFVMVIVSAIVYVCVIFFRGSESLKKNLSSYTRTSPSSTTTTSKKDIVDVNKLPLKERMDLARQGPTLVFDGICNLCNGSMSWFQDKCREDSPVWYMWAQHPDTHEFLHEIGISRRDILTSWAYIDNGIVYRGSIAWIMALQNLIAPWRYFTVIGKLFPACIRENIYKYVAANRYNALGHSDACQRPNPSMKARFLHKTFVSGDDHETQIPPVQKKRLLVIGCGPSGLMVAKKLAKTKEFAVTVVEPKEFYEFTPGILRGMCDPKTMQDLVFKLEPVLCDDLGMSLVQGIVTELESHRATVRRVPGGTLRQSSNHAQWRVESCEDPTLIHIDFDYCVVAAGTQYKASRLWKVQANLRADNDKSTNAAGRSSPFSMEWRMAELAEEHQRLQQMNDQRTGAVSIMGAGLVGVELAAEIRHFFPNIATVKLFDPMPTVLPTMPDSAQLCAARWMREHSVDLVLGDRFNDEAVAQAERDSDVVYKCVGVTTNVGFLPAGVLDNKGEVRVNAAMQIVAKDDTILFGGGRIFAIGDCAAVDGAPPFPKDIYPAEAMAGVVIANLCQALTIQCMQTRPGVLCELDKIRMVMNLCSLGPNDCIFTMNGFTVMRGKPATFIKETIQYTKMSDSRNEMLGTAIWSVVPHF